MANDDFYLEIISPEGIVYSDNVTSVSLPAIDGQIMVLPHHAPIFTKLDGGEIVIYNGKSETTIVIAGGFLEVKSNKVHVLSDYAIRAESIEQAKAEERKRKAEDKLKQTLSNEEFTQADKDLKISILELKVAQKMRRRHSG